MTGTAQGCRSRELVRQDVIAVVRDHHFWILHLAAQVTTRTFAARAVLGLQTERKTAKIVASLLVLGGCLLFDNFRAESFLAARLWVWCRTHGSLRLSWVDHEIVLVAHLVILATRHDDDVVLRSS